VQRGAVIALAIAVALLSSPNLRSTPAHRDPRVIASRRTAQCDRFAADWHSINLFG
jgi:hypothetical protein